MKKLIKILFIIALAIGVLLTVLYLIGPRSFKLTRSILIQADKAVVWERVSKWDNFSNWSAWTARDTAMTKTIEGTDGEVGAKYTWKSESQGNGSQTILVSKPMSFRESDLVFEDWGMTSRTSFELQDSAGGVFVTWSMYGENGFMGRIMGVIMNMEKMVGPDYEAGLAKLKMVCESHSTSKNYSMQGAKENTFPTTQFIAIRKQMSMDDFMRNSSKLYSQASSEIMTYAAANSIEIKGTLHGIYYTWDEKANKVDIAVAFPVAKAGAASGAISFPVVASCPAVSIDFYGPYEQTELGHAALEKYLAESQKVFKGPAIEEYVTDPGVEKDPSKLLTRIWYPVQ